MNPSRVKWLSLVCGIALLAVSMLTLGTHASRASAASADLVVPHITRDAIIARAKQWLNPWARYSETVGSDGYRHDCSGYVSWAWGLSGPGLVTQTLLNVATPINQDQLQPGDILDNGLSGNDGHVALFAGWVPGSNEKKYYSYEESPSTEGQYVDGAVYVTGVTYPYWHDAANWQLYKPYRFNGIDSGSGNGNGGSGDINGRVLDGNTGQGIASVQVSFSGASVAISTHTDSNGQYAFHSLPVGVGAIAAATGGYVQGSTGVVVQDNATVQAPDILLYPVCMAWTGSEGTQQTAARGSSGQMFLLTSYAITRAPSDCTVPAPTSTPTSPPTNNPPPTPTNPPPPQGLSCNTPSLSSPGNGSSFAQSTDIALYWNTNCAQSYTELSGGPYGTLNFGGWQSFTSVDIGQMWPGTYTWEVQGMDSNGNQTPWSSSWTFSVNGAPTPTSTPTSPPSLSCNTPSLSSPSDGSSFAQSTDIALYWNTDCAQSYTQLSGGPYGTLTFGGWNARTSLDIGQMWPGTYTWEVQGMDSNGNQTPWSSSWTFTINNAPTPTPTPTTPPSVGCGTPSLASPGNGSSYAQNTNIVLYWNTNCAQSFTQLSGGPYGTLTFGGWNARTSLTIGQMWPGTYTWEVQGMDSSGRTTNWSSSWTFTINNAPAPTPTPPSSAGCSTPSLASPGNGSSFAQSTSIVLYWNTNCAQSFTQLSGGPYGTLTFGGWNARTSLTIGQMWPGTYTWEVQGMDSSGRTTNWSSSWTFTIQ